MIGDSESEDSWNEFFRCLKDRGLNGVDLIVSDDHRGLVKAMHKNFQGTSWQHCQTHFMRNIMDAAPRAFQGEVKASIQAILNDQYIRFYNEQRLHESLGYQRPIDFYRLTPAKLAS